MVWLSRRLQARGETECALRVVEGHQEGLTGRWQHGVAALAPGLVTLRRRYVGGARIPRPFGRAARIEFSALSPDAREPQGLKEAWSLDTHLVIYEVTTPTARIEWAIPRSARDWVLRTVLPS